MVSVVLNSFSNISFNFFNRVCCFVCDDPRDELTSVEAMKLEFSATLATYQIKQANRIL